MRRVLVVALENASGDPSLDSFGRLAAQWIADNLAKTQFVDVASDIVKQSNAATIDLAAAAAESRARLVVTGTYFVIGDSLRAQLRIHDVVTGNLLPGSTFVSSPRATPAALLDPLGSQALVMLATRLDPRIAEWSMGAAPQNIDAYLAFVEGLDQISAGNSVEAVAQWQRAAELDSTYMQPLLHAAAVLSGPARAHADSFVKRVERRRATLSNGDRAWLAAVRANIDGNTAGLLAAAQDIVRAEPGAQLPYFFIGMAAVRVHRPNTALAAEKHVNYTSGRFRQEWTGNMHFFVVTEAYHQLGQHNEELEWARTAVKLHPQNRDLLSAPLRASAAFGDVAAIESMLSRIEAMPPSPNGRPLANLLLTVAGELAFHGHPADAERLVRRVGEWQRTHPFESTAFGNSKFELARALYFLGEYGGARELLDSLLAAEPTNPFYLGYSAANTARADDAGAAAALRRRLDTLERPFDHGETPYARALVAAQLGDIANAVALLGQSLERGMPPDLTSIHTDLMLSPLWGNAEFERLLEPKD
jgi:tetratricopeptide (TPR) repeat protein/TolB-like protein